MKKFILLLVLIMSANASEKYIVDTAHSNAYYKAVSDVLFVGSDEIIGINKSLRGELTILNKRMQGTVFIDSGKFDSQSGKRDEHVKEILNHSKYPYIKFTLLKERQNKGKVYLKGKLFINGVSKEIEFAVKKRVSQNSISYRGKISIKYKDFNITAPTLAGIIKQAKESIEIGAKIKFKRIK